MSHKVVLDRDDVRRTLVRIAHEIVEKNPGEAIAIVGIHRRGALLAGRLRELVAELVGEPVPLGDVDISFYRDDVGLREPGAQPVVHASHIDFSVESHTVVLVDDVLFTGRTVRAAIDALFDYGRPGRVQLAVLADRGHRELPIRPDYVGKNLPTARDERVYVNLEELDGEDQVLITPEDAEIKIRRGPMKKHLLSIDDLTREDIERILHRAESFAEVSGREIKKVPTLRGRTVINLFYEASTRTSSSFEIAAKRLSADLVNVKSAGSSVDKGESLKDTVQTLSAYDPAAIVFRSPVGGRRGPGRALDHRVGGQRRRRQARAPHPGAAGPVHAAPPPARPGRAERVDRGRRAAQPRRPLEHPGLHAHGLPGHRLRPADTDPARGRGAGLRRQPDAGRHRRGRRDLRAADAARAHDRLVRALAARVRDPVPDQLPPAGRRPAADAPRSRSTAASSCRPRSSTRRRR